MKLMSCYRNTTGNKQARLHCSISNLIQKSNMGTWWQPYNISYNHIILNGSVNKLKPNRNYYLTNPFFTVKSMAKSDTFENKIVSIKDMILTKTPSNTDIEWQWYTSLLFFYV